MTLVSRSARIASSVLVAALAICLVLAAGASADPMSAADAAFVDQTVTEAMAPSSGNVPGLTLQITGPKGDYVRSYGVANRLAKTPMDPNMHFRVGSVTKMFTATAVLEQVDRGTIKLDDPLEKYIPGVPNGKIITIRDLLTMKSGLYEYTSNFLVLFSMAYLPTLRFTPEQALSIIKRHKPVSAPGVKYSYANSNYLLLGLILQKVTGKPIEQVISEDVLQPFGMTETSFARPSNMWLPKPFASGYMPGLIFPSILREETAFNADYAFAAGAVISTVGDLTKFTQALRDGKLLSPASFALRTQSFCTMPYGGEGPNGYGYSMGLMSFGRWLGHNGAIPGYGTAALYDPVTGATYVGFENTMNKLKVFGQVLPRIAARLYPDSLTSPYANCAQGSY
jgi:D-alanyl-D-alanine carboxypeptidase